MRTPGRLLPLLAVAVLPVFATRSAAPAAAHAAAVHAAAAHAAAVHAAAAHAAAAHAPAAHAPAAHAPARPGAAACDPTASLRPAGPPQVTSGSFMARIRARGYLIAGVDQNTYHFGYLNPFDGQIEGFDVDMVHQIAAAIFGDPNKVHFKAITDAQRIPVTTSGAVDIVAHTMTITCARLQQVDFSTVYYDAGQRVLVESGSRVAQIGDLGGKKVCATTGSDSLANIAAAPGHPIPVAAPYWTDCLVLLQEGGVSAISTDDSILVGLAAQDPYTRIVGPRFTDEPYGLAISAQHPDFVRFVNAVLAQIRGNGQWAASYAHWIGTPVPPPPPAHYKD
ncbi:MAG TPA: glutamate ABC transporter substrate-binding protein [Streptosporangiaceae bacterium]|nr:glutamate ABC transporter substrate-binding protein [Streptosporangiaceae bacterium]